jgi:membrane AbrB-like protein
VEAFFSFCLVFGVGSLGYFAFRLLHIPNPALLGAMAATGALNIAGCYPVFDTGFVSFVANVTIGIMLGRQIDRNLLRRLRILARPVLLQVVGMLTLSLACGVAMHLMYSNASVPTALISGAAGGITEMAVFAMSIDADAAVVVFIQLFRVVIFLFLIPCLSIVAEKIEKTSPKIFAKKGKRAEEYRKAEARSSSCGKKFGKKDYALLTVLAFAGAIIGIRLEIPTGAMLGAMFGCGLFSVFINKNYFFDDRLRNIAQIGLGLVMGQRMKPQIVSQLSALFFPAMVVTVVMLTGCVLLAFFLYRTTPWDLTTCLLCSAPAGMSQIVTFADEIGVDPFTAAAFHTVRNVGIVSLYPWLVMPFTS